jgi:hypothetical protein
MSHESIRAQAVILITSAVCLLVRLVPSSFAGEKSPAANSQLQPRIFRTRIVLPSFGEYLASHFDRRLQFYIITRGEAPY